MPGCKALGLHLGDWRVFEWHWLSAVGHPKGTETVSPELGIIGYYKVAIVKQYVISTIVYCMLCELLFSCYWSLHVWSLHV